MNATSLPFPEVVLDSLNDGLYVCDTERRILYWSKSAERITGWTSQDVVGRKCSDNILCHVDKDGAQICGEDTCPLHRAMVTNTPSSCPVIVFGQTKAGTRVPMLVSVAPVHGEDGTVIGGVENFHDFSETYTDLKRAQRIQTLSQEHDLPDDHRLAVTTYCVPHDMVGGDFVAIRQLDADRYGFFLADAMGHGVAAALHTMHLSSLWSRHYKALAKPSEFAALVNRELCKVVKDESFATAICGVVDVAARTVRFSSAGGPPPLLLWARDGMREFAVSGLPFGAFSEADYEEEEFSCGSGDSLLMFTDGAVEILDAAKRMLDAEGLVQILESQGYPEVPLDIHALQRSLLNYSNSIRLDDDMTFLEIRFA
jgi:sigma-B regulation protein RsbU (phosphoserine phosphatase)